MKLVEILAREWKNWPVDAFLPISQSAGGRIYVSSVYTDNGATFTLGMELELSDDFECAEVTRAQWKTERARIAANQQATKEAREISRTGGMTSEEQELADIACGKRSKEDQELRDNVALDFLKKNSSPGASKSMIKHESEQAWLYAEAFMAERAKRMK